MKKQLEKNDMPVESPALLFNTNMTDSEEMKSILTVMEKLLHWAAIVDSSDDAIMSKSVDGYITSWNRGAQKLYGYTPEEIIGKPVSVLMPPEKENDFPFIMKQLLQGKKVDHYETKRLTKDGRIIDVSITVSPIRDSQGTIIGASKIARDITERVENEKRRDEFVSIASHELKTPLTSQKAFGELLEKIIQKNGDTTYLPYIEKINKQTDKLTKLVEDLLELSRVQSGRLYMQLSDFSLDELVDEIVETMQMTISHTIKKQGKTKKMLHGDRERLGQVLINLLANAYKYSPLADTIEVTTTVTKNTIIISIKDYGIGIAKEYQEKIFERFFRVSGVDERIFPGMGIGLNICKEIITRHQGNIWVESEKGKGSTFFVSLPLPKKV